MGIVGAVMGKCALDVLLLVTACNTWLLSDFQVIQVLGNVILSKSHLPLAQTSTKVP